MYDVIVNDKLSDPHLAGLDQRERFSKLPGISKYAARKAIHLYNNPSEDSEKQKVGRPLEELESDHISAVKEIVRENSKDKRPNTIKTISMTLKIKMGLDITRSTLMRDLHSMGLNYRTGDRKNVQHDFDANTKYRYLYVNQRLLNINSNGCLERPEVFLDESYCHVNHHARKTWTEPGATILERGRGPMLVIFAAFIVFPFGNTTRASMIKDSITVWPVKGSRGLEAGYHGHFNSGKFEELFQKLCITLEQYGERW
ncbi:hypothetical protein BD560DRAFT_473075 [Blakeslea trispora]|nr:hypothetical protein BD560DRAFT_473075 [Blakeslea trispora]